MYASFRPHQKPHSNSTLFTSMIMLTEQFSHRRRAVKSKRPKLTARHRCPDRDIRCLRRWLNLVTICTQDDYAAPSCVGSVKHFGVWKWSHRRFSMVSWRDRRRSALLPHISALWRYGAIDLLSSSCRASEWPSLWWARLQSGWRTGRWEGKTIEKNMGFIEGTPACQ